MPKVKMSDLGAVDGPVPEATYSMRVDKAEYVEVPKDKHANPYIRVWHVITGPDDRYMGRYVFANYPITGKGSYRLHELLHVTGHSGVQGERRQAHHGARSTSHVGDAFALGRSAAARRPAAAGSQQGRDDSQHLFTRPADAAGRCREESRSVAARMNVWDVGETVVPTSQTARLGAQYVLQSLEQRSDPRGGVDKLTEPYLDQEQSKRLPPEPKCRSGVPVEGNPIFEPSTVIAYHPFFVVSS
jgi:hypothetical protein